MDNNVSPPKPWEMHQAQTQTNNYGSLRSSSDATERKAPPVPPRPTQQVVLLLLIFRYVS